MLPAVPTAGKACQTKSSEIIETLNDFNLKTFQL